MKIFVIALLSVICTSAVIAETNAANDPTTHMIRTSTNIQVVWTATKDLQDAPSSDDISIVYGDKGTPFAPTTYIADPITLKAGDKATITFTMKANSAPTPSQGVQTFTITINNVNYSDGSSAASVQATGTIYDRSNIKTLVTQTQAALAVPQTTQEKDLFAGLNISIPSGTSSGLAGDLAYNYSVTSVPKILQNSPLYDSGNIGFDLNAGSETANNARHFNLGLTARKTFLFAHTNDLKILLDALTPATTETINNESFMNALQAVRKPFWRAAIIDYGFQSEGDVSTQGVGGVTNALLDIRPQIATAAASFGGDKGYFSLRFMPIGTELGHNIAKPTTSEGNVGGLIRAKSALDLNLYYKNSSTNSLIGMIELTGLSMYRYLFETETAYDPVTNTTTNTTSGSHPWNQLDLKFFSGQSYGKIHPGLKISYQDGSLPPVYSKVHTFTYGLVFETY